MWQEETEATNASSGSTASSIENGTRTACGDDDAGTSIPPSNDHVCPRVYRFFVKLSGESVFQEIFAVYVLMLVVIAGPVL